MTCSLSYLANKRESGSTAPQSRFISRGARWTEQVVQHCGLWRREADLPSMIGHFLRALACLGLGASRGGLKEQGQGGKDSIFSGVLILIQAPVVGQRWGGGGQGTRRV